MAHGFLAVEEERFFELAVDEWGVGFVGLEDGAAARFLREDDFRDVEKCVDAGDLVDFFADEVDGFWIRDDADADAFFGADFFLVGAFWAAVVAVSAASGLEGTAFAAIAGWAAGAACAAVTVTVVTAGWAFVSA